MLQAPRRTRTASDVIAGFCLALSGAALVALALVLQRWAAGRVTNLLLWPAVALAAVGTACGILVFLLAGRDRPRKGRALAESGISIALLVCLAAYLLPPLYAKDHLKAQQVICLARLHDLARALRIYLSDYEGAYPPASSWCNAAKPYLGSATTFACPSVPELACGFAANSRLAVLGRPDLSAGPTVVTIFESDRGWDAYGWQETLPIRPRHLGGDNYAFADGHVEWLPRKKLGKDKQGRTIWAKQADADWVRWKP